MELFISEAEIEDASMIIDYLNQVGGESDNLTYGLNECYLNEFEEMEVIQDFIDQENSLLLCGSVVARINTICAGGSSNVFNKALNASGVII